MRRGMLLLTIGLLALPAWSGVAHAKGAFGSRCTIVGTAGADKLAGTAKRDVICGRGGKDVIKGRGGDDLIDAGPGKDRLSGGAGSDRLDGGDDKVRDRLSGGAGPDYAVVQKQDVVRSAIALSPACNNQQSVMCATTTNSLSTGTVDVVSTGGGAAYDPEPQDVAAGAGNDWAQEPPGSKAQETGTVSYQTPDGSLFIVESHVPISGAFDPYISCSFESGPGDYTCEPVALGSLGSGFNATVTFQPQGVADPESIGAGQPCTAAPGTTWECAAIGATVASNEDTVTFKNIGPVPAVLQQVTDGQIAASHPLDPGQTWEGDVAPDKYAYQLQNSSSDTAVVVVTDVVSWGHD